MVRNILKIRLGVINLVPLYWVMVSMQIYKNSIRRRRRFDAGYGTDEPYSLVGRTQTGEFNIYVGTGCLIS